MLLSLLAFVLTAPSARAQTFDLYEAKLQAPTIVFVHGGAWVSRSKAMYKPLGEALAKQGYCAVVFEYELAPQAKHPKQVDELETALEALKKQKSKVCKLDQIYLVGHSAGAHMISFWNSKFSNPAMKGFIGLEGIYDIPKLVERWPSYKDEFIETEFGDKANWIAASPTRLKMKSRSPWLIIQSDQDELVDAGQAQTFLDHLHKEGVRADLVTVKGLSHFGAVDSLADAQSEASKALKAFIERAK